MAKTTDLGAVTAYALAVKKGFVGTEDAWLKSLIGPQGAQGSVITGMAVNEAGHLVVSVRNPATGETSRIDAGEIGTAEAVNAAKEAIAEAGNAQMQSVQQAGATAVETVQQAGTSAVEKVKQAQESATDEAYESANRAEQAAADARNLVDELLADSGMGFDNAGSHNSIFRGKNLGGSVTPDQYEAISNGTFKDLYIGDYWTISGVNYRVAAFDYYFNTGDTVCTKHHAVIVPDTPLYTAQMHKTPSGSYESGPANTTEGGYVGTDMYKTGLDNAKTAIKTAFAGHVLSHRLYLTNAVVSGKASNGAWFDSEVDLMTEHMVYGNGIFSPVSNGSSIPANYRIDKSQLPLFTFRPDLISDRQWYWLRDVVSASSFARVAGSGTAYYDHASNVLGVRPAFLIS